MAGTPRCRIAWSGRLVAMVEAGEYFEAIRQFYRDDATMQENLGTLPRRSPALVGHEETVLRTVNAITRRPGTVSSLMAPMWSSTGIRYAQADGHKYVLAELAYQTWRCDSIAQERLFRSETSQGSLDARVTLRCSTVSLSWSSFVWRMKWRRERKSKRPGIATGPSASKCRAIQPRPLPACGTRRMARPAALKRRPY